MEPLNSDEKHVIIDKGTERPFSGEYWEHYEKGVYVCRQCGGELYRSGNKFESHCGWPSFDDEIAGAVTHVPDADGRRTEIVCSSCGGHLGHVFKGEGYTPTNTRHCVNSISLVFIPKTAPALERAIFAGGCFWGVEHYFQNIDGVSDVTSGYIGGRTENPTYEQVCSGETGHAEAVEVTYDPSKVSYEKLAKLFFEIHDPSQKNRQGPDVGSQYRSAVFYQSDQRRRTASALIDQLGEKGLNVVTELSPAGRFWPAEQYHQDYLLKHPNNYICHTRVARFGK